MTTTTETNCSTGKDYLFNDSLSGEFQLKFKDGHITRSPYMYLYDIKEFAITNGEPCQILNFGVPVLTWSRKKGFQNYG